MPDYKYKTDYNAASTLRPYGNKGLMLYALALHTDVDDVDSLAATSLTDNSDDKGIDVLHFIPGKKTAIIIQGYFAEDETKPAAKSKKASDFNTAISWALHTPIEKVPETIRTNVNELRNGIELGEVKQIIFWYVHNLDESANVQSELDVAERTAKILLAKCFPHKEVFVSALEVGNRTLEKWYKTKTYTILVDDIFQIPAKYGAYEVCSDHWKALHTTVPLEWLRQLYEKHGGELFSANIRGYMGTGRGYKDINKAIKETCINQPNNFWIFNNGITCLVHKFDYDDAKKTIKLTGISIINGAQTTGAVGSVNVLHDGYLPIRFVTSDEADIWRDMIKFNNSQNRIFSYDFRSNDEIQKRLREEFKGIPDTEYTGRRGGAEDIIKRNPNIIGIEKAAISLVAFHGDPYLTYHKKREIWDDTNYYLYYSESLTAEHLVLTYSLLVAIEEKKKELSQKFEKQQLTSLESREYEFLKKRGGMRLYLAAIGKSMEEILGGQIGDARKLSFGKISWKEAVANWKEVVEKTIMYTKKLNPGIDNGILNPSYVPSSIDEFKSTIASQLADEKTKYDSFRVKISL